MKLQNTNSALFLVSAFALAFTSQAQNRSLPLQRNSDIQNYTDIEPSHNDGPETVVWSESFANGIPTGWSTSGTANGSANTNAVWVYRGPAPHHRMPRVRVEHTLAQQVLGSYPSSVLRPPMDS